MIAPGLKPSVWRQKTSSSLGRVVDGSAGGSPWILLSGQSAQLAACSGVTRWRRQGRQPRFSAGLAPTRG
jgi:hypothetical protein